MSNDKDLYTRTDTFNKEGSSTNNSEVGPSDITFVNGLKALNIGTIENNGLVLPDIKSGFNLNDLAKAHLNQASFTDTNTTKTDGLNFKLDFNNLPPHELKLKEGCHVMIIRNIKSPIMMNGTRAIVKYLGKHIIEA